MSDLPLIMTPTGPVSTSPADIRAAILAKVAASSPGYSANLPGTLIEDILSTDVAAIAQCDQYRVDAVNSITPYGANAMLLQQLGEQLGISQGAQTNTSVYVVFSGTPGYIIPPGFIVSDGTHQYVVQDGGTLDSSGTSSPLYAVSNTSGSWSVAANTVTTVVTSVPSAYTITVNNPSTGTPGTDPETVDSYRARILEAQKITGTGVASFLKTNLKNVANVQSRLVSVVGVSNGWKVICGGGDPYQIAGAIYNSVLDITSLQGSDTTSRNVTASVIDSPNVYDIIYVNPPQQTVKVTATWNTQQVNFSGFPAVSSLAATAIQDYINSIVVGQPINTIELNRIFQDAVAPVIESDAITYLSFSVKINGTITPPTSGTDLIYGDSESYFYSGNSDITVTQG